MPLMVMHEKDTHFLPIFIPIPAILSGEQLNIHHHAK